MKILAGDHTLEAILVNGRDNYFDNRSRDTLEMNFAKDKYTMDELYNIFKDEKNTSTITLLDEDNNAYNYYDYVKLMNIGLERVLITPADSENPDKYDERVIVRMCQLSFTEKQLKKTQAQIEDILVSMVEEG